MLQDIRDNIQGLLAKVIITIMVIPFAFFGVQSLLGNGGGQLNVASVNGEDISASELEGAIIKQKRRLLALMGENADPNMLDDDLIKKPALDQIIQKNLLLQLAASNEIDIASESIDQTILAMPEFQVGGQFSAQQYQNILRSNGYNASNFKSVIRQDMLINQLNSGLAGSDFSSEKELAEIAKIVAQKRSYRYLTIPLSEVSNTIETSAEDIKAYYDENEALFQTEDQVKLSYIEVKSSDFFKPVDEEKVRAAYQLEVADSPSKSERRAAHILIEINEDKDKVQARSAIDEIAGKLAAGANFADLARDFSDDGGSANAGGDVGFTQGDAFPPEFEEALFNLALEEVSDPVLTESGYHLILVTEISDVDVPSFDDRKVSIELSLQRENAELELVAAIDELKDLVFNSEDLQGPAEELKLVVQQSDWISRTKASAPLSNPQVLAAAFGSDVLGEGNNSDVIELAPDHFVVVRVGEFDQSHTKELSLVSDEISAQLARAQAIAMSRDIAEQIVIELADKSMSDIATERAYPWQVQLSATRQSAAPSREVQQMAFTMPEVSSSVLTEIKTLASGDVVVLSLESVEEGKLSELSRAEKTGLAKELQSNHANQSFSILLDSLRAVADVEIY